MVVATVRLTEQEYQKIKRLVERGQYLSVSDFIRTAVREHLNKYE
ncbi:MAG TPA: ribbon-helix-helix protein, CopG family [Archaeoglobus sp.]|nr:ribbon-helix-helix protein, CopG family [Archaeoglobus sp.]